MFNISLTREGNNLTYYEGSQLSSHGHGILGAIYVAKGLCPNATHHLLGGNLTAYTVTEYVGLFCTDAQSAGRYRIAVQANYAFGPFPDESATTSQGHVGPDHTPLAQNDPRALAKQQVGYGSYRLQVLHLPFLEGRVAPGESRPICAAYGQWRSFYVDTTSAADATLDIHLTGALSNVYVRANALPIRRTTAVAGSFDVIAPPRHATITASPCDVLTTTRWYFSTWMEAEGTALDQGVAPIVLNMEVALQDARLNLSEVVAPRIFGGRGYACCGAMRIFRLPQVRIWPHRPGGKRKVAIGRGGGLESYAMLGT